MVGFEYLFLGLLSYTDHYTPLSGLGEADHSQGDQTQKAV
jgi:hypothetical protein